MILAPSAGDRALLLAAARLSVERAARGGSIDDVVASTRALADEGHWNGAFVSLHERKNGDLRGCIGHVPAPWGLLETVCRAAEGSATRDPRFERLSVEELAGVVIEVSLLEQASPIGAAEVVVGRHGLILEHGDFHGLLLPQVPVDWGWDRETYLDQLCRKAGLPKGAWREPEVQLLAFEACCFEETS